MGMTLVNDTYNKLCGDIDKTYFPDLKYYGDDKNCAKVHYTVELFSNGCLHYGKLITKLSKLCKVSEDEIEKIAGKYITFAE